ncbi:HBR008Cp [Eremothecium sinecaudum]|uniref:Class E vacuolar protein-sorting machinery protein HSE1 n=1 Tax=Eremothecium sinecaudum TaxID=45286 RepID=A0A109UWP5_9SACH|nr:HBR008Cp [Eremothecium sinecaudum]AMD18909.1 HBR008Cp [Eremothecium sinecaudum]
MVSKRKIENAVKTATAGELRADNWQYHLDVCDLVRDDPEELGKYAMEAIEERLKQNDANVILRTLSLITCLAGNCGSRLQQAIASKHFTGILYNLTQSKYIHMTVKQELIKVVEQLTDSFKHDPSLKAMADLNSTISRKFPYLMNDPSVPQKKDMDRYSKAAEEEELERALKQSLLEYEQQQELQRSRTENVAHSQIEDSSGSPLHLQQAHQPNQVRKVRAVYDLKASEPEELSFVKGDIITVIEQVYRDWWRGSLRGKVGIFPLNYVTPISAPSSEELATEAIEEQAVLRQKPKVDKLLQSLKHSHDTDITQNQEVNELYSEVTPLRPKITKMLGKYAQKKDDLISLREVLANAESTYNRMLDEAANGFANTVPPKINQKQQYYDRMEHLSLSEDKSYAQQQHSLQNMAYSSINYFPSRPKVNNPQQPGPQCSDSSTQNRPPFPTPDGYPNQYQYDPEKN